MRVTLLSEANFVSPNALADEDLVQDLPIVY
jgi:hypothetical protein